MADQNSTPGKPSQDISPSMMSEIGRQIAEGISAGLQKLAPQKVAFGRFDPRTPFHPKKSETPKLLREVYQNGIRCHVDFLHDAEIKLLNQITHSGRYIDRRVEIVCDDNYGDGVIYVRYNDREIDQRFENKNYWRNFGDLLQQVVTAQAEERANDDLPRPRRQAPRV